MRISGRIPISAPGTNTSKKSPALPPYLKDIHIQNPAGFVSFGFPVGDVPSMKRGVAAVVSQISRDLFFADLDAHERRITGDVTPDFGEELYAPALWRGREETRQ
jgi:hypothetical protein